MDGCRGHHSDGGCCDLPCGMAVQLEHAAEGSDGMDCVMPVSDVIFYCSWPGASRLRFISAGAV